jgi:hypothetical protein
MATNFKNYQALIRTLKKHVPPAFPISVRRIRLGKHLEGRCWKHGKTFAIEIDKNLDPARAIDVLIHEWAHARAWNHMLDTAPTDEVFNKLAHDAAWGVAYSEVYSAYERNFAAVVL